MQPQAGQWQHGTPVPPPGAGAPLKPSGWWYGLAVFFAVGGIGLAIFLIVSSLTDLWDKVDSFSRISVPGEETVRLDNGDYTIYQEYSGASDSYSIEPYVDIEITGPDGRDVPVETYFADVTYTTPDDHEGVASYSFEANEAGEYTFSVDGDPGVLAVGPGIGGEIVKRVLTGLGVGLLGLVLCALVSIITGVKRGQDRRRRFVQSAPNQWPGQPGPGAPYPGGGGWGQPPGPPPYQPPGPLQPPPFG